ncbi:DUF3955 domain-containing protein [Desulfobaculum bizertense]|uniref:DUF3955 domain-containing protein n=1 Tax=Desulfobaculum bizertense DSM 18034 TaxID=1121442 RepID=A0A1T4W4S0_9BACT|nr:DUF3955 domain-containing protein [Desulfobaculum bizertense]UIJ38656.1 DUF3955 domain-containing protein [Desulfobaculum bizertense]SKA72242.1 Protein of unknown function [Desulfobaculum bizertense DSM 18034]
MLKKLFSKRASVLLLLAACVCLFSYRLSGSYIDDNGILHESFGFIPLGWLFFLLSLVSLTGAALRRLFTKKII